MQVLVLLVSFFACTVGAICGIGGGIIIKPVLDATGVADVATINFLSGCTVLSMTLYSVLKAKLSGTSTIDPKTDTPLAIGAAVGGLAGKELFSLVAGLFPDPNTAGAVQAGLLLLITLGTLIYTIYKEKIPTLSVTSAVACLAIGFALGVCSSFLGIGGGPINLVVLFYFFTMATKRAASSSLYIILFSQATSTASSIVTGGYVGVDLMLLVAMVVCGILGGIVGRKVNADRRQDRGQALHGPHGADHPHQRVQHLEVRAGVGYLADCRPRSGSPARRRADSVPSPRRGALRGAPTSLCRDVFLGIAPFLVPRLWFPAKIQQFGTLTRVSDCRFFAENERGGAGEKNAASLVAPA